MRIPTAYIEPELEATERYGAIRELLKRLVHAGALPLKDESAIFTALSEREETMSTGIGFSLGIPHIFTTLAREPVFAFGRSHAGIDFDSLDSMPVEFVFLFILPANSLTEQKRLGFMASISRALVNRRTQETIRCCTTAQEIGEVLEDAFNND